MRDKAAENEPSKQDQIRLAQRLAAISNAKPVICPPSKPRRKSQFPDRAQREAVFRLARIFTGKNASVRCIVYNISATGARITMEGAFALPPVVILKLDYNREIRKSQIIWQNKTDAGLKFIENKSDQNSDAPSDEFKDRR